MARVAQVMSKTRNRSHSPLIGQLRTLDKKPLKVSVPPRAAPATSDVVDPGMGVRFRQRHPSMSVRIRIIFYLDGMEKVDVSSRFSVVCSAGSIQNGPVQRAIIRRG